MELDPNMGRMQILKGEEIGTDALNEIHEIPQWTWLQYEDFVTVAIWDPLIRQRFWDLEDMAIAAGAKSPAQIPNLAKQLRNGYADSIHMADRQSGLTGVGSFVFRPRARDPPFKKFHPDLWIANLSEGQFGRIGGLPGSGKTRWLVYMIKRYAASGRFAFSNVKPTSENPAWSYVTTSKRLFSGVAQLKPSDRWTFFMDEAGIVYSKADAATRRAKDLDKLCKLIRKFHGNFVLAEQRPESVPTTVQDFAKTIVYCERPGTISWELKGPIIADRDRCRGIPNDDDFDTYDPAFFRTTDLDLMRMFDFISGKPDIFEAIREFLKLPSGSEKTAGAMHSNQSVCLYCGNEFERKWPAQKFCCKEHQTAAKNERLRALADEIGVSKRDDDE